MVLARSRVDIRWIFLFVLTRLVSLRSFYLFRNHFISCDSLFILKIYPRLAFSTGFTFSFVVCSTSLTMACPLEVSAYPSSVVFRPLSTVGFSKSSRLTNRRVFRSKILLGFIVTATRMAPKTRQDFTSGEASFHNNAAISATKLSVNVLCILHRAMFELNIKLVWLLLWL